MNIFGDAFSWLFDAENWHGQNGLIELTGQHLWFTLLAVVFAALVAVPVGWLIGHTGRGRELAVGIAGAARALPSFGLVFLFVMMFGARNSGPATVLVLVVLAIPPILAGAYAGLEVIDRRTLDAARAMGMTEWQILWKVEVPLGLPLLLGGLRSATLQVVATVSLAAFLGLGSLGLPIIQGIALRDYDRMLGAAILIIVIALVLDAVFALLEKFAVPRGVRAARAPEPRTAPTGRRAAVVTTATTT
ncbi:MAG: ABC transporter permease [Microcella sp.]|uniref:ABC transporter permease n=1 Tax=Microcella sp. TaxID=1913979 RepID=UPI0024C6596A|nr:ABC transporter permease [Microcella sp.]UYN84583.1 MAG: ABC transporter permease [Microcella sp.]